MDVCKDSTALPCGFQLKIGKYYQSPPGTAADPPPGWLSFCCFPLECLGAWNLLGAQISPRKMDEDFHGFWELSQSTPSLWILLWISSSTSVQIFSGISNSFTGIPVPLSFLKTPYAFPVPSKCPCIRRFRAISLILEKFLNLESS